MSSLHSHSLATIAFQPAVNDAEGKEYIVAVQHYGEAAGYHKTVAFSSMEAWFIFHEKFPDAVRIEVSPLGWGM